MVKISTGAKSMLIGAASLVCASSALAQSADSNEAEFSALLQAIADQELSIAQQQVFIAEQKAEIASLQGQIEGLDELKTAIPTMLEKMTAAIEDEINSDYPFDMEFRQARLGQLKTMIANKDALLIEKYRKALNVYKIEVNYGQSLDSYQGNHPINPTVRQGDDRYVPDVEDEFPNSDFMLDKNGIPVEKFDGNYLRYGRTAFVYLNEDGTDPLRYDLSYEPSAEELQNCQGSIEKCRWRKIPKNKAVEIRRAIRVSRGEVAPTVISAPVSPMP